MLEECSSCGLCKTGCPIWIIEKRETLGPRGKAILLKGNIASASFFKCTLCKSCEISCPIGIDMIEDIRKAREKVRLENNERMIKNIREYGNPFGKPKGEVKDLVCC